MGVVDSDVNHCVGLADSDICPVKVLDSVLCKGPDPLSNSVRRSDQLLRETNEAHQ